MAAFHPRTPDAQPSARAGRRLLRRLHWVPVRRLRERHRGRLLKHLLELNERDRYLRFGYPASDEQVQRFVATLDFRRDEFFGIYDRHLALIGTAHLALAGEDTPVGPGAQPSAMAEFAVSVSPTARGRGFGALLFRHAMRRARNRGIDQLFIHALSENTAMLRIASRAGAEVERHGSESEAWLKLPAADLSTRWGVPVSDRAADADYQWKLQRRLVRRGLEAVAALRRRLAGLAGSTAAS